MKKIIFYLLITLYSISCIKAQDDSTDLVLKYYRDVNKFGFLNRKDLSLKGTFYSYAEPFSEGLALVEKELKFGYIDKNYINVISYQYDNAGNFSDGMAYVKIIDKYGYIDRDNNLKIPAKFDFASNFNNGYAIVYQNNTDTAKFGTNPLIEALIDKSGNLIGNQWFSVVNYLNDSLFEVRIKKTDFYLKRDGVLEKIRDVTDNQRTFFIVDKMPKFPKGDKGLRNHIRNYIVYPYSAIKYKITGKVYIRFKVSYIGEVTDVSIAKGVHPLLDKSSLRIIKKLPKWKPGIKNGKPVNVWFTVPINFNL